MKNNPVIFVEIDKMIEKFVSNGKGPRIVKVILKKRTKLNDLYSPALKLTIKVVI